MYTLWKWRILTPCNLQYTILWYIFCTMTYTQKELSVRSFFFSILLASTNKSQFHLHLLSFFIQLIIYNCHHFPVYLTVSKSQLDFLAIQDMLRDKYKMTNSIYFPQPIILTWFVLSPTKSTVHQSCLPLWHAPMQGSSTGNATWRKCCTFHMATGRHKCLSNVQRTIFKREWGGAADKSSNLHFVHFLPSPQGGGGERGRGGRKIWKLKNAGCARISSYPAGVGVGAGPGVEVKSMRSRVVANVFNFQIKDISKWNEIHNGDVEGTWRI